MNKMVKKTSKIELADLPLGFGMRLSMHPVAAEHFYAMEKAEQQALVRYVQSAANSSEAKQKVETAIARLEGKQAVLP